jgi:hypothetical protein
VRLALVLDSSKRRCVARQLAVLGDDERDRLHAESDLGVTERAKCLTERTNLIDIATIGTLEARGVFVRKDLQYARKPQGLRRVDARDLSSGDCAGDDAAMDEVRDVILDTRPRTSRFRSPWRARPLG